MASNRIDITVTLNKDQAASSIDGLNQKFKGMGSAAQAAARQAAGGVSGLTVSLQQSNQEWERMRTALLALGAGGAVSGLLKFSSDIQKARISLTQMLGSATEAAVVLADLKELALSQPFQFAFLKDITTQLSAFGFKGKDLLETVTAISDAAAGVGGTVEKLNQISLAIGQIKVKGRLNAEEINKQLGEAGVPASKFITEAMNRNNEGGRSNWTTGEVMKLAENQRLNAEAGLAAILDGMRRKFGGLGKALTQEVLSEQFNKLLDKLKFAAIELGEAFTPAAKAIVRFLSEMVTAITPAIAAFARLPEGVRTATFAMAAFLSLAGTIPSAMKFLSFIPQNLVLMVRGIERAILASASWVATLNGETVAQLAEAAATKAQTAAREELVVATAKNILAEKKLAALSLRTAIEKAPVFIGDVPTNVPVASLTTAKEAREAAGLQALLTARQSALSAMKAKQAEIGSTNFADSDLSRSIDKAVKAGEARVQQMEKQIARVEARRAAISAEVVRLAAESALPPGAAAQTQAAEVAVGRFAALRAILAPLVPLLAAVAAGLAVIWGGSILLKYAQGNKHLSDSDQFIKDLNDRLRGVPKVSDDAASSMRRFGEAVGFTKDQVEQTKKQIAELRAEVEKVSDREYSSFAGLVNNGPGYIYRPKKKPQGSYDETLDYLKTLTPKKSEPILKTNDAAIKVAEDSARAKLAQTRRQLTDRALGGPEGKLFSLPFEYSEIRKSAQEAGAGGAVATLNRSQALEANQYRLEMQNDLRRRSVERDAARAELRKDVAGKEREATINAAGVQAYSGSAFSPFDDQRGQIAAEVAAIKEAAGYREKILRDETELQVQLMRDVYADELKAGTKSKLDIAAAEMSIVRQKQPEIDKVRQDAEIEIAKKRVEALVQYTQQELEAAQLIYGIREQVEQKAGEALIAGIERRRDLELKDLEVIQAVNIDQKIAVEVRKTQIELTAIQDIAAKRLEIAKKSAADEIKLMNIRYEAEVMAGRMSMETLYQINVAARQKLDQTTADITQNAEDAKKARTKDLQVETARIIVDQQRKTFDGLKDSAGRVFDSLLTKSSSIWAAIGNSFKTAMLTAIKEVVTSRVAATLMEMFGLGKVSFQGGRGTSLGGSPVFGGGGGAGAAVGGLGILGGLFGRGAGGGGGGISLPSYGPFPGATPPFLPGGYGTNGGGGYGASGGVVGPTSATTGAGAGAKGYLASLALGGKGFLTKLGNIGYGPKGGDFGGEVAGSYKGVGGLKGGAMLAGGAILAMDGIRRGGKMGMLETTAGGALIGAKFGGWMGAAIGAAVGAGIGLARMFFKTAVEKVISEVKSTYRVSIDKNLAQQIADVAKQQYGGNIRMAILSPQVRELIELYAMSTGQNSVMPAQARPYSFSQSGGALTQQSNFYNGLPVSQSFDRLNGGSTMQGGGPVVIQLDGPATVSLLRGEAVTAVTENPRSVVEATMNAIKSNAGRREMTAIQLSPGLLTS